MKILVAATGGTIGSAAKDGVISTDKGQTLLLLELFRNAYGNVAEFQVETLCSVLSENADDTFYETLCGFLKTVNSRNCTRSNVVKREPHSGHSRRRRIQVPSSVRRESLT